MYILMKYANMCYFVLFGVEIYMLFCVKI